MQAVQKLPCRAHLIGERVGVWRRPAGRELIHQPHREERGEGVPARGVGARVGGATQKRLVETRFVLGEGELR